MEFKDRKPKYPGRVRVFNEKGSEQGTFFVELADGAESHELGTPLNRQTFHTLKEELLEKMKDYNKIVGPAGPRGEKGDKGEKGDSGVAAPAKGFFSMSVEADGNLYVCSSAGTECPEFEYDPNDGKLYLITEE